MSERPKRSPQPRARSRCCFITQCVTAWITSIRALHIMRPAIENASSKIYIGAPMLSASFYTPPTCPPSPPQLLLFLRKAAVYFAKESL